MNLYLHPELNQYFTSQQPLFDQLMALRGEMFRDQKGRLTQRVTLGNKAYFIKQHRGVGWQEIIKNVLQARLPVISAYNEWSAINKLQKLNIAVPAIVGYGKRGINPATQESFILMEEIAPAISLEDLCRDWNKSKPNFSNKKKLIEEVAYIARTLHQHGMNHRDFYICHFLLAKSGGEKLYLIDLHRAQIRKKTPTRWIMKDLAGLYFSSKDIGLTQHDWYRFMCAYRNKPLLELLCNEKNFWQEVKMRGEKLYREHMEDRDGK